VNAFEVKPEMRGVRETQVRRDLGDAEAGIEQHGGRIQQAPVMKIIGRAAPRRALE
jgi:hypothetical protein